jgi:hypothetical protein
MYDMWFYGAYYPDPSEPKLGPAALREALTTAIARKDGNAARAVFDHAFWHKTPFKPDWFHLYLAADNKDREMVKLLTTYGATWTPNEAKVACVNLAGKLDNLHGPLHAAGIRTDYTLKDLQTVDASTLLSMNQRILIENKKNGHNVEHAERDYNHAVSRLLTQAALKGDIKLTTRILRFHRDAQNPKGIDISAEFAEALGDFLHSSSARALKFVDTLLDAGIKLQPIDLHKISSLVLPNHYDLLPALNDRDLLPQNKTRLRNDLLHAWTYLQSRMDLDGYILEVSEKHLHAKREKHIEAAGVLCDRYNDISAQEADRYIDLHKRRSKQAPDAVAHMDQSLLNTDFFNKAAFTPAHLHALAEDTPNNIPLAATFNKMAQKKVIDSRGINYFLHKKRFDVVATALKSGALVPDGLETEAIMRYLQSSLKKDVVTPEVIECLTHMRDNGAEFFRVRRGNYLGTSGPGLAKALLDLDIIKPRDISTSDIRKRCGQMTGISSLLNPDITDRHHAMREFLYQVTLEKSNPDKYKPLRDKVDLSYQRRYLLEQLAGIRRIQTANRNNPPASRKTAPQKRYKK